MRIAWPTNPRYLFRQFGRLEIWFWSERGKSGRWLPTLVLGWGKGKGCGIHRLELARGWGIRFERSNW